MPGIYIHIPFCKQACHYCDFHFSTSLKKKEAMLASMHKELKLRASELEDRKVETIYFGGGTPSLLQVGEINKLLSCIYANYKVETDPEITLEANPDDLSLGKIKNLSEAGINRLSIGVQSFFEEDLRLMNRAHSPEQAHLCLEQAMEHFENISIDLIYGIPGMSNKRWLKNIKTALQYDVPHISAYALTVEPRTALKSFIDKGVVPDVDEEQAQEQFLLLMDILEENGFVHYEISNFGKPGYYSRNNTSYWQGIPYIGIGPSAHSYDGNSRAWNIRNNSRYIKSLDEGVLPLELETLSNKDRYNEYVMTGLRTIWGVSLYKLRNEFGPAYEKYFLEQAQVHINDHLLYFEEDVLKATKKGKFLVDGIASHLFMLNLEK